MGLNLQNTIEKEMGSTLSKIMAGGKNSLVGAHFGITPQPVTKILTEVENNLAESKQVREEINEIKCKL